MGGELSVGREPSPQRRNKLERDGRYVMCRVGLHHPERVCCALVFGGQLYIIRRREIFSPGRPLL